MAATRKIRRAIIDKHVNVPGHVTIGYDHDLDRERGFTVTEEGLVVVPKSLRVPGEQGQVAHPAGALERRPDARPGESGL